MDLTRAAFVDAWPQVVRALAAATGSIDDAEDLAAEAFARAAALATPPDSLVAWCIAVGRRAAIDLARRRGTERAHLPELWRDGAEARDLALDLTGEEVPVASAIDDRVALLLVACDDVLPAPSRMVLAMRLVLGIPVDRIAAHLGMERGAAAARLTRAKRTLAEERGGFGVPTGDDLERRMPVVLDCVHGMLAIAQRLVIDPDDALADLATQSASLASAIVHERPDDAEARAVLAIVRLALARRPGRLRAGAVLAPDAVDRSRWDAALLRAGIDDAIAATDLAGDHPGRYVLEARIAALHSAAPSFWLVPWPTIAMLHAAVELRWPAPSATLSRLVAHAYGLLADAGAARSGGRVTEPPEGLDRILAAVAAIDDDARSTRRDVALTLADLAWRTRRPDAAERYAALADLLDDDGLASEPVRAFCRERAAAEPGAIDPGASDPGAPGAAGTRDS